MARLFWKWNNWNDKWSWHISQIDKLLIIINNYLILQEILKIFIRHGEIDSCTIFFKVFFLRELIFLVFFNGVFFLFYSQKWEFLFQNFAILIKLLLLKNWKTWSPKKLFENILLWKDKKRRIWFLKNI